MLQQTIVENSEVNNFKLIDIFKAAVINTHLH